MASSRSAGCSTATTRATAPMRGQGNHNLSIADVDDDGRDEIIFGAATIDDNGTRLYATGLGHGDALHVGDFDPSRAGPRDLGHPRVEQRSRAPICAMRAPARASSRRLTTTAAKARAAASPRTSGPATPAPSTGARART